MKNPLDTTLTTLSNFLIWYFDTEPKPKSQLAAHAYDVTPEDTVFYVVRIRQSCVHNGQVLKFQVK